MSLADQQWSPTSVQVTVHQARGLRIKGKSGTNDAYAVMQVGKEKFQTSVVEKAVAPVWKEEASFDLPHQGAGGGGGGGTLHVHVLHRALVGPDKLLGQAVINLLQLSEDKTRNKTEWFKLLDKTGKPDKDRGEVLVDIQFLRNNMTASMFDLSAAGKSRSRLGKFKDKVRGKKKESDTSSNVVPSLTQVLTDSEEEGQEDGGVSAGKDEKKKKLKIKSLFSPKSNLQKNMSQSMSVLPAKNSPVSGSLSSGLNVDTSEGKKKFKFKIHKRTGSSDSKDSSVHQKHAAAEQSNLCINGSHVYCEEPPPRTSRIGSNYSLASSGHGSMEDVPDSSPPSVDSLRAVRQYSPWTEEEEEEATAVNHAKEEVGEDDRMEDERRREVEELEKRKRQEEEEENRRATEEKAKREEEERISRAEEDRVRREEEEELQRIAEEKKRQEEEEEKRIEEEKVKREEEERKLREEEERTRREEEECERFAVEMRRREEQERWKVEEEERQKREEEERTRMEREREQEERRKEEEEERARRLEEERQLEEKRKLMEEEERRRIEEEKAKREEEERALEECRRREEEEMRRRQEEKRRLEEYEREMRQREEEERIKKEEERMRKEREEYERAEEEKRKQEEEEKKRIEAEEEKRKEEEERLQLEEECKKLEEKREAEEQEKRRVEEEEKRQREESIKMEEERVRKEREEYERVLEEQQRQEELERRIEEEEKARKEEQERIERERKRKEEEEEQERIERERKRREEEEEQERIERERKRREEEEEQERLEWERKRREEEERVRTEMAEMERLAEEKRKLEEEEKMRIEEEEKRQREEEERVREKEKEEEEARRLEKEKLEREAEEQKKDKMKPKAVGRKVDLEFPAEVTSTNPFDENYSSNPFEEIPSSPAEPDRCQSTASMNEKDLISSQRGRRTAPQPPGKTQAERQTQKEQDVSASHHLAQMNKQSKDKNAKTLSLIPKRSVKNIAPVKGSATGLENTQNSTLNGNAKVATSVAKPGKRVAPPRPSSVESQPTPTQACDSNISKTKQEPVVYGLNPFEEDEDEPTAQNDTTVKSNSNSVQWPLPDSQAAEKDATSQMKVKSSKMVHAPPLPATKTDTSSTSIKLGTEGSLITEEIGSNEALNPKSETISLVHVKETDSQHATVQIAAEEAGGKKEAPPPAPRRLQPVKPLNSSEQQPLSAVHKEKEIKSTETLCEVQEKTKVNHTGIKGPYSQLTQQELISMVLKQENQLRERDKKISELELYIDNLLVRVIDEAPTILQSINALKKVA
ncbi:axoneme-associated protein mst101(2)-like [Xyrichtys novacula]|uniref:Axoneme-associated protein mst101(2)-like n=1 Tax=Xyrichtys novacula TaxID=13765 RepID=A0AAV1GAT8_XYRNO|nr:axoneme-associated protein mst101(2)-like [Xyrichtys novacula]